MEVQKASAGNAGDKIRSDCRVTLGLRNEGGLNFEIKSKVGVLFGRAIREQLEQMCSFFRLEHADIVIEDSGAITAVIAARFEAALKILFPEAGEFLLPMIRENEYATGRDCLRLSRLYLPGNTPALMLNAGIHKPNGIILDLEDAVAPEKKHEARFMVRNALRAVDFYGAERMVRINQIPRGLDDLDFVVPHNVNLILVPKCESADEIRKVNQRIEELRKIHGFTYDIWLMPIIESALGVIRSYEIATAAPNVVAMAIGLEDFTADMGVRRTNEGTESFLARTQLVLACKAAKIQPIDSVFSDIDDMEALKQNVLRSKSLGFEGMGCIHPRQIPVIHENFAPEEKEIEKAQKIVLAFEEAESKGLGVVSLGSKMIDPPVVKRAFHTINLAIILKKINSNWKEAYNEQ
jgi:citrate lyase subunit beta / citryl-CoA lyase